MWKLLYHLSSPKYFYRRTISWVPWLTLSVIFFLVVGLVWGLVFAPADYQQGDAVRIIYLHVPCAFLSVSIYAGMGFLAILLLVWRFKLAGILLSACAQVGACMTLLALITGSLWGKPMWGAWWVWDARLTSELILLFLYGAIIAMDIAWQKTDQGDKMLAILTLVGLVDLPIIHYSVNWWSTLHQGSTLSLFSKPKIEASMLYPLLFCLLGFALYSLLLILLKTQNGLLRREARQSWVKSLIDGELL